MCIWLSQKQGHSIGWRKERRDFTNWVTRCKRNFGGAEFRGTEGGTAEMHYSHSSREPTGNIKTAPPNRKLGPRATGARTGSRLWKCGVEGRSRTGARSKAGSESALRRRRGRSRNCSGPGHGVGRQGCRPHWHRWMCASAVVLARCPWTSWLGSRSLRRQRAADESRKIPAVPSAEIGVLSLGFYFGELVSFSFSI
jgi:hypothetical protein